MKRPLSWWMRWCALVVGGLCLGVRTGTGADEAQGPIVELPKFVVTDSRELPPPEAWRYGNIPGFEVLSNASDKATQRLLSDFEMFRQALGYVWPMPPRAGRPATLIICGRGGKFDAFVPAGKTSPDVALASLLLKQGDQAAIVIDLQATTLNVLNVDGAAGPVPGTDSSLVSVAHDKQLYREYVRFLLSPSEPRLPAWFEEGLSQIIMKMKFYPRWIEFARLEDANAVSAEAAATASVNAAMLAEDPDAVPLPGAPAEDRDFPAALRGRALVPLEQFFALGHNAPEALNPLGNNRWAKQAYAFVHMCLYGERGKYQKPFAAFLQRATREPVTEAMVKECFGMTYKQMLLQIRSYAEYTVYQHKEYRTKTDVIVPPPPLALREATQSEVGRIKGEALLLAGHRAAGRTELIAPYIRGERDPYLLAALGLYERTGGDAERARKFLEAAVAAKIARGDAYLELARIRYAEADAKPAGPDGAFSTAQAVGVADLLVAARRHPPQQSALYELLADTWTRSTASPKREEAGILIDGVRLFPAKLKLAYQSAVVCARAGLPDAAHSLVDHGIQYSPDPATRGRFEALKRELPAEASPAAAPAKK